MKLPNVIFCPFTVIVDTREQAPWLFRDIKAGKQDNFADIIVDYRVETLQTGDYSIAGFEDRVCIERKSIDDAFGTFGGDRERFERELDRMEAFDFAAVIVEGSWASVLDEERPISQSGRSFSPFMFRKSVAAWRVRRPQIQWCFTDSRTLAEQQAFDLLERYWKDQG